MRKVRASATSNAQSPDTPLLLRSRSAWCDPPTFELGCQQTTPSTRDESLTPAEAGLPAATIDDSQCGRSDRAARLQDQSLGIMRHARK